MNDAAIYARRWWITGVLCLCTLVIAFDNTILNVALPTLARELAATAGQLQWLVDAYSLAFGGLLLTAGSLGDRFGRKRVLMIGLAVFALGSVLGATAGSASHLVAIRAVMGLGGALIMPSSLAILATVFPREERTKAIAVLSSMVLLGMPFGPIMGGWLLDHFRWNAIFLINVPVIAAAVAAGLILLPESRNTVRVTLDPLGAALSVGGLGMLLYAIIEAPSRGWTDVGTLAAAAVALLLIAAFVAWEARCRQPMLDLRLFANPAFSAASVAITLVFFGLTGALFFLTQYMQFVLGYTPLEAGVRIIPLTLGLAAGAPSGAVLVKRLGVRYIVAGGLGVTALGIAILATTTTASGYERVALTLAVMGVGLGLAAAPATDAMMGALPSERVGVGSAVNDTVQEVGGALGVAVLGSVLTAAYGAALASSVHTLPAPLAAAARNSIGAAVTIAHHLGGSAGHALLAAARAAFVQAMSATVLVAVVIALAGVAVALLFLPSRPAAAAAPSDTPASARRRLLPERQSRG